MYILGIDTTFHKTSVSLINRQNKVICLKSIDLNFSHHKADEFINAHLRNLLSLLSRLGRFWSKIDMIVVNNKEGAFHSLSVGVVAACIIGLMKKKKVVGVDHELAHLYSVWLDRKESDIKFPVMTLSVSGAHTAIYHQINKRQIEKVINITWQNGRASFPGVAAFFDEICHQWDLKLESLGQGGLILSKLANKGEKIDLPEINILKSKVNKNEINILGARLYISQVLKKYGHELKQREFQETVARLTLEKIFNILIDNLIAQGLDYNTKHIHLVGGVAANKIFQLIAQKAVLKKGVIITMPIKKKYCLDNAAMIAVCGKYQNKDIKLEKYYLQSSQWYNHYYCQRLK